jgi:hypothetical protein
MTPEAKALVDALGMQPELTAMLEHTRQTVTELESIDVERYDDPEGADEPRVVITAWRNDPDLANDRARDQWRDWFVETFSGDVRWNFGFSVRYRVANAG